MNGWDIAIIVGLTVLAGVALFIAIRARKKGRSSCSGDCASCSGCPSRPGKSGNPKT